MNANPLHAEFYADHAISRSAPIVQNSLIARDTYRLRLACPDIAGRVVPGQFVMVRLSGCLDPLIGRALAVYDIVRSPQSEVAGLDLVYIVKGKFTQRLARMQLGQKIDIWGPLGNGFPAVQVDRLVLVAGGIGQTPFLTVAQQYLRQRRFGTAPLSSSEEPRARSVTLCYGARRADLLAGVEDFRRTGLDVRLCTDDGSHGHHGPVTDVLQQVLDERTSNDAGGVPSFHIFCCGPEPMMEAVSAIAEQRQVPCHVSLETPMACGIGICFTCVARVRDDQGGWDYKRTCVEGPVFDGRRIEW